MLITCSCPLLNILMPTCLPNAHAPWLNTCSCTLVRHMLMIHGPMLITCSCMYSFLPNFHTPCSAHTHADCSCSLAYLMLMPSSQHMFMLQYSTHNHACPLAYLMFKPPGQHMSPFSTHAHATMLNISSCPPSSSHAHAWHHAQHMLMAPCSCHCAFRVAQVL